MKKVLFFMTIIFSLALWPVYSQSISGATPPNTAYIRNSAFTIGSINISGRTGDFNKNFVDILPMHPTTLALDRTNWLREGTTDVLVSIPFVIEKAGGSTEVRAKGTTDTVNTANVFVHDSKNTNFTTDNYEIVISSNANSFANGTYLKVLRLRLWNSSTIANWTPSKTSVTVDITVRLVVSGNTTTMSLTSGTIDFGEVTTNETASFTVGITSYQPYTLTMTSANNFRLEFWNSQTSQYEPISGENVPYQIIINSKTFSPTANPSPVALIATMITTPPRVDPYLAVITLQTVTATTGGDYKDTLTFTASAP